MKRVQSMAGGLCVRAGVLKMVSAGSMMLLMGLLALGVSCGDSDTSEPDNGSTPTVEWTADGVISPGEYAKTRTYGNYELNWRSDQQYVYVGMKAKTTGFVALGIQPGSRMKNADMVFGFVKDGETTVHDLFSTGDFGPHPPDTQMGGTNDITVSAGKEEDGYTTIEFQRALVTGDQYDNPLSSGQNKIIWSYGSADDLEPKHSSRGYGELDL